MTNIELAKIIGHVYWVAYEEGRLMGKDNSPKMKDFDSAQKIVTRAICDIRKLIKADRKKAA